MKTRNPFGNRGVAQRQLSPTIIRRRRRSLSDDGCIKRADLDFIRTGLLRYDDTLQIDTSTFLEVRGSSKDRYLRVCAGDPSLPSKPLRRASLCKFDGFGWTDEPLVGTCTGAGWQGRMLDRLIHHLEAGVLGQLHRPEGLGTRIVGRSDGV